MTEDSRADHGQRYADDGQRQDRGNRSGLRPQAPDQSPGQWLIDIQAGAGIVADSRPDAEYIETLNKAKALLAAIAIAADGAA